MAYNWHQIGKRTWSHSFVFLRQARNTWRWLAKWKVFYPCEKHWQQPSYKVTESTWLLLKGWNPVSGYFEGSLRTLLIDTDSWVCAFQNFGKQLSYSPCEGMCSHAFTFLFDSFKLRDPKHSPLSLMATVSCISEKHSTCFGSNIIVSNLHRKMFNFFPMWLILQQQFTVNFRVIIFRGEKYNFNFFSWISILYVKLFKHAFIASDN